MRVLVVTVASVLALSACKEQAPQKAAEAAKPEAAVPEQPAQPKFTSAGLEAMAKAADGADGSGCPPDEGTTLSDGAWFGFITDWDASGFDFDSACFYTGEEATKVTAARGEESPPPNDFYITNDNKAVRRIAVAPGASALRVTHDEDGIGGVKAETTTYADLVANPGTYSQCPTGPDRPPGELASDAPRIAGEFCPVWIFINGGQATEVTMQYLP